MNDSSPVAALAEKFLQQIKQDLGTIWSQQLNQADQDLIAAISSDAASLVLDSLIGTPQQAAQEKAQVDAQLLNVTSAESAQVNQQFWASVGTVIKAALGFAIALS